MDLDSKIIRVVPTQGRDYKNTKDALSDWKDNKDFRIVWGEHSGRVIGWVANESSLSQWAIA
jgi:hypothetical protein